VAGPNGNETNHTLDGLTVRGGLAIEGVGGVKTYLNSDVASGLARQSLAMRNQGVYAETYPVMNSNGQTITTTGTVYGVGIGLLAGDVVTNLTSRVSLAGATVSLAKMGLYSKAGTLLCSSASNGTAFETTGVKTLPMTTPYTVPTDDYYFAAFIAVSAVTMPTNWRSATFFTANSYAGVGSGQNIAVLQLSQADLPASATFVTSTSAISMWIGVS
jgi:hypothetical protein